MAQSSILFWSDPHNSDQPPRMRKEGYREQILAKQEFLIKPAQKADLVIVGGDIFHQKKAHKISYYLMNRLMEIYREYGSVYIVPGNHDFDMRPEEIKDNPLGVLGKLPNVQIMHGVWANGIYGMDILFKGLGDSEAAKPLDALLRAWQEDQTSIQKDRTTTPYNVAVIHDNVSTKKYPFETISFDTIEKYADLFFFGHLHTWQELGGKVVAPGALSRGVLEADSVDRNVGYAWVSVDTEERRHVIKGYKIPIKPAEEVFRIEEYGMTKTAEQTVNRFIEHLEKMSKLELQSVNVEGAVAFIEDMDVGEAVKKKAIDILRSL